MNSNEALNQVAEGLRALAANSGEGDKIALDICFALEPLFRQIISRCETERRRQERDFGKN